MPPYCVALQNLDKMMQGEERHYYCMYVWEDVWPLSRASTPAPHVTHTHRDQMWTKIEKTLRWNSVGTKESRFWCYWDCANTTPAQILQITLTHILTTRTPEAILAHHLCNDIHFSSWFTPPCWHLWTQAICEPVHTAMFKASKG